MRVEILYVAGCPHVAPARAVIEQALAQRGVAVKVRAVLVSDAEAASGGFGGSPTVLVNGRDVEPGSHSGVACRIYANGTGVPSREACARAIARALEEEGETCNEVL
jgi:hypothetical protein